MCLEMGKEQTRVLPVWWSVLRAGFGDPPLPLSAVWPWPGPVVMVCDLGVLVDLGCWHVQVFDSSPLPGCTAVTGGG